MTRRARRAAWWKLWRDTRPTPMIQQSGIRTYARSCAWPVHCSDITPASCVSTKPRIASLSIRRRRRCCSKDDLEQGSSHHTQRSHQRPHRLARRPRCHTRDRRRSHTRGRKGRRRSIPRGGGRAAPPTSSRRRAAALPTPRYQSRKHRPPSLSFTASTAAAPRRAEDRDRVPGIGYAKRCWRRCSHRWRRRARRSPPRCVRPARTRNIRHWLDRARCAAACKRRDGH